MTNMHDSGKQQEFETGAVRDTAEGKSRPDLISPFFILRMGDWLALALSKGKYEERNYEKGIPIGRCMASTDRHLLAYKAGENEEDNLIAAATNLMFIAHYEHEIAAGRLPASLQDLPRYEQGPLFGVNWAPEDIEPVQGTRVSGVLEPIDPVPTEPVISGPFMKTILPTDYVLEPVKQTWEVLKQTKNPNPKPYEVFPTLYITGPMRGRPNLNWEAFDDAADKLRAAGFNVISPAHEDRRRGIKPNEEFSNVSLREIIRDDLEIIQSLRKEYDDGLASLGGWYNSTGATAEMKVARWLGLPTRPVVVWLSEKNNG